jgi:alpha-L-rhamnosidase
LLLKTADVLGYKLPEYEVFLAAVKQKFHDEYVGDDGLLKPELNCNTQTAYVLALHFGLAEDKQRFADHLAEMIRENDNHLKTGFVGTPYIMDVLSENGHADVAYSLLLQKTFPSWLYSVLKGATTIWEHWDGIKPDGTMWSTDMNSFNHYAYGAVAAWMYGTMAGINPDEEKPGYEHIIIRPIVDERLDYVRASIETKYGTVKSGWEKTENGGYLLTVTIPKGTTATVTFGGKTECVTEGTHTFKAEK